MALAFMHIGMSMGMGDRLEHLLRQAFFAALHLPDGCLLDAANLLRKNSRRSARLRAQLSVVLKDQFAATFWKEDFDSCARTDYLAVPAHVLAKLLSSSETVGAMLSQGRSAFDFRQIMENRQVLLVNLSMVGSSARQVLAPLILSLLHLTAVGLGDHASPPCPFHIYCDDTHRIELYPLEDLMAEGRRLGVSLTMAQQDMGRVTANGAAALSGAGSTIIFSVDGNDAQVFCRSLQGKVDVDDLVALDVGQAIARIGSEVVRVRTLPPLVMPRVNCRDLIVQQSHERYYRPMP